MGYRERADAAHPLAGRVHFQLLARPAKTFEVYSSPKGCTSCIVQSLRSRRSFISSPLWTPSVYGPTSEVQ